MFSDVVFWLLVAATVAFALAFVFAGFKTKDKSVVDMLTGVGVALVVLAIGLGIAIGSRNFLKGFEPPPVVEAR